MWEARERAGAQLVNEPGTWTMSLLNTRDAKRAQRFYHDVFGWNAESLGEGPGSFALLCLPGYVGGEPAQPVPRDVVAAMTEMTEDRFPPRIVPHWGLDFHVPDAAETAQRCAQLGGRRLLAFETPFSENAVLMDPFGAVFNVHHPKPQGLT